MTSESNGEAIKILVVDDEEVIRETLKEFLSLKGFYVTLAGNGPEALQALEKERFDVVLSDLVMPRMNGISLTKTILETSPQLIVIVMTAYASIDHAVESMKAGAFDFIAKPFNFDHVIFVINRALENRRLRDLAGQSEYYRHLAKTDGLTGIWNHRHFQQNLENEIQRQSRYNRPFSLLFIDIDDFKLINDTHGHLVGDSILIQLAELLKKCLRSFDFLARYGGEEFVVILPETPRQEAVAVGKRILSTVAENDFTTINEHKFERITITIGLATYPEDAKDKTSLIESADAALYAGKERGKNRLTVFGPEFEHFSPANCIDLQENGDA